jgi:hypothetical protein
VAKYTITIQIDDDGSVTVRPQSQPQKTAAAAVYTQPANGVVEKRLGSSFSSKPGGGNGTPGHGGGNGTPGHGGGNGTPGHGGGNGTPEHGGGNGTPEHGGAASVFSIQTQQQIEWCWAAVAVSIDKYFNPASIATQCQVASDVTGGGCCGPAANGNVCNQPEKLQDALRSVNRFRTDYTHSLKFPEVKQEIDDGRPVAARIQWASGAKGTGEGHFVVIDGYRILSGASHLHVSDPLNPSCWVDFDEFTDNYQGEGTWDASFLVEGP